MKFSPRISPALALVLALVISQAAVATAMAAPVTLVAADGVKVFGDYSPATAADLGASPAKPAPLILAFHRAGASHLEYTPITAKLNAAGFGVLAIDQRSGGDAFGKPNQTVAALGHSAGFLPALQDLEAALVWGKAKANGAPLLVWGSSYSAALVFLLTAKHPADVQGLLAFSPGEYLGKPDLVAKAAKTVGVPVFIDEASDPDEVAAAGAIYRAVAASDKTQFVPRHGTHGSATLREDTDAAGAAENWAAVMTFLSKFKGS